MKETDTAWAAGFFEGEGGLTIGFYNSGYSGHVDATQNAREPLDKLQELFGGKVRRQSSWHVWQLPSKTALPFLKQIYPYIVSPLRKKEIAIYTAFWNTIDHDLRDAYLDWWEQRLGREKGENL